MGRKLLRLSATVCWLGLLGAHAAETRADPIQFFFTGEVTAAAGTLELLAGESVTGFIEFDSDLVDAFAGGNVDSFRAQDNPSAFFEMAVSAGGFDFTTTDNPNTPGTPHHFLTLSDTAGFDQFEFRGGLVGNADQRGTILMAGDDSLFVGAGNLPGTPPTTPPDPDDFVGPFGSYEVSTGNSIQFSIETMTLPEPGPSALALLAWVCVAVLRRAR